MSARRLRRHAVRRPTAVLAALLLTGSLAGCVGGYTPAARVPASASMAMADIEAVGVNAKTENGRIVIRQDASLSDATVSAEAKLTDQDRAERFSIEARLDGDGTLVVRPLWPDGQRLNGERCNIEIVAPVLHGIVAKTSNGSITLSGGQGEASLKTSNGAITIEDRAGDLNVRTSNGRIELARCTGAIDVQTSNGAIRIRGVRPEDQGTPFTWRATTSNGSITLDLDERVEARIRARTSNARATLERKDASGDGRRLVSGRSLDIGEGPSQVLLTTSNGSITVRTP